MGIMRSMEGDDAASEVRDALAIRASRER